MRLLLLTAAALAALAFVSPASAQIQAAKVQAYCPDLTFNQIKADLDGLMEQYEFSTDPDEASLQAAGLLCQYAGAEAEGDTTSAMLVMPPHGMLPPHRVLPPPPRPRHAMPRLPMPRFAPPRRYPPPRMAGMQPPYGGGYGGGGYGGPAPMSHQRVRGEPYCLAQVDPERFARERPAPRRNCEIGPIPNKPCPGWVCKR